MGIDDESSHPELCSEVAGGVTRNIVSLFREPDAGNPPVRFSVPLGISALVASGAGQVTAIVFAWLLVRLEFRDSGLLGIRASDLLLFSHFTTSLVLSE